MLQFFHTPATRSREASTPKELVLPAVHHAPCAHHAPFADVAEVHSVEELRAAVDDPCVTAAVWDMSNSPIRHACDVLEAYIQSDEGQAAIRNYYERKKGVLIVRAAIAFPWKTQAGKTADPMIAIAGRLLANIGFSEAAPQEARQILQHLVLVRRVLHGFGEPTTDFQVNTYSVVDKPHFHNDIALLFPYAGEGPLLIRNELADSFRYLALPLDGRLKQLQIVSGPRIHTTDVLRTGKYRLVLLKGRRDRTRPWAVKGNVGSLHRSPGNIHGKSRRKGGEQKHFRFLAAHFVYDY